MPAELFLGIDIGTFESKGVLVDAEGRVHAEAVVGHPLDVPRPGWAEHDPEAVWWGDTCTLSRRLLAAVPGARVAAAAVSAIGPCVLPCDAAGDPLTPGILYGVDTRAGAQIAALNAEIGASRVLEVCGNALTSQSTGPKMLWLREERPEVWAKTAVLHTSTSFIVERLTGARVIDHYTAANAAPIYDPGALDWTGALTTRITGAERLPRLDWSTAIAGHVTAAASAATGLAQGVPVTVGTIDAAAEAVSVGVLSPGDLMLMYGSTVFAIALTDRRLTDARLWSAPWLFPGRHASMAGLATSGTLTRWLRAVMGRELGEDAFAVLTEEAAQSQPGANGLVMLPYFSGERTPLHDPLAKGAILGLNLTHTRGDIMRAALEGIAMANRAILDCWRENGLPVAAARAVGGGTRNAVWLQAISDFGGLTQTLCARSTGASYGDAFLAAVAVGAAAPGDMARWNPPLREITPVARPVQEARLAQFRALYEATKAIAHAL